MDAEPQAPSPRAREGLGRAALLYAAFTLLLASPLSIQPGCRVLPVGPDGDLFMWTLAWDAHAFVHQPASVFDANIYHPQRHTLAYSENLIGSAFIAAPILWLTDNHVLAMNMVALVSCMLCGLGTYVLARRVGLGWAGAFVAGLVFAFAPPRFFRLGQLHLTTMQWVPFGLAALHSYLDAGRRRDLRIAVGLFSLQALTSGHGAVFLAVSMIGLAGFRLGLGEPLAAGRRVRDLGVAGFALLVPAALVVLPYRAVQAEMGLRRTLENWEIPAASFFASPSHLHGVLLSIAGADGVLRSASAYLFPGYLPLALALAAVLWRSGRGAARPPARQNPRWSRIAGGLELLALASLALAVAVQAFGPIRLRLGETLLLSVSNASRSWIVAGVSVALRLALAHIVPIDLRGRLRRSHESVRRWAVANRRNPAPFYALVTVAGLGLSLGPPLGLWPLVYWLPGFNFIRVPSRFTILALLGLAVLAGIGFERVTHRLGSRARRLATAAAVVLLVAEFAAFPLATVPGHVEIPPIDRWLATRPRPFVVAEVPLPDPRRAGPFERRQTTLMLHSMAHWQKTVHGYSGLRPARHEALYGLLRSFPDRASLDRLVDFGVTYVVVHAELYTPAEWAAVEARIAQLDRWLRLEHVAGPGRVYSLRRAD